MLKGLSLPICSLFTLAILLTQLEIEASGIEQEKQKTNSYSRYEELARAVNPSFSLKLSERYSTSNCIDSYPSTLAGVWGGKLKLYRAEFTDLKKRLDPQEVEKTSRCLKVGRECSTNRKILPGRPASSLIPNLVLILVLVLVLILIQALTLTWASAPNRPVKPIARPEP